MLIKNNKKLLYLNYKKKKNLEKKQIKKKHKICDDDFDFS